MKTIEIDFFTYCTVVVIFCIVNSTYCNQILERLEKSISFSNKNALFKKSCLQLNYSFKIFCIFFYELNQTV